MGFDLETRIRNVTAVLGPTNTGKTRLAIERMLAHESGMIGLPLRLLAREVYDKVVERVGADRVALITGEEKIRPANPRFWVSTVEAMPREIDVDFLAIDEIQLAADPERGHVFTDRLLHARGRLETFLLGAQTIRDAIADVIDGANFITRARLSKLTYSGQKKITRMPSRTAIVAFSANDVYAIAELIRRQQGGAAVVMGALSPRTRNAQVALYQSGDVDHLVATDAIGMGLNLDVDHVAFAATRKFDGHGFRQLTPAELAQIAGRAGRYMNDGTFGVTGDVEPLEHDAVERLETHTFDTVKTLQWRSRALDFSSLAALRESLREIPRNPRLVRARMADDVEALETVSADREVVDLARAPAAVGLLWDVCQIPDYRKISSQNHAELIGTVYKFLLGPGERIPEDWFANQVALADRTDGDIDTLANRIAHIRTWTFVSNRQSWLKDPGHWQTRTREIEDSLSDALHERLTERFIDRRTSALMKGMRDKDQLAADIAEDGAIQVESHYVGRLRGFLFHPDGQAEGIHGKAARSAAAHVLSKELTMRVRRVVAARNDAFRLTRNGRIQWRDQDIARLEPGEDGLKPQVVILSDEHLQPGDKEKVQQRLDTWINDIIAERLKPLAEIARAEDISGLAKGIAFRLTESFGALKRDTVAEEIRTLDQPARAQLRKYGVRFGAFNIYFPQLLKPIAAELTLTLWALKHAAANNLKLDELPEPPRAGLTSVPVNPAIPEAFYRAYGFHVCGPRAVRIDIIERLADQIRPLVGWRASESSATPPRGATGDGGFTVTPEMMSILGCSTEELGNVLRALGFRLERRPVRPRPAVVPGATLAASEPGSEAKEATAIGSEQLPEPSAASSEVVAEAASASPAETAPVEVAAEMAGVAVEGVAAGEATPAPETANATEAAAAEAAEPAMEEVWRPRRRRSDKEQRRGRRQRRPHHGRDGKPTQAPAHAAAPGGAAAEGQPLATVGAAGATGDAKPDDRRHGQQRRDGERKGGAGHREGGHRHHRDDRRHGKGGGFNRRDERKPRPAHEQRSASPPSSKRQTVDPDSPFAKLGALKLALEKRAQEPSSS
jgi:ATP-dependent RNA helicase SUPV3L1/SUV3